jgi:hypothetical protein
MRVGVGVWPVWCCGSTGGRLVRVDVRGFVLDGARGDRRAAGVDESALLRARAG